MSAASDLPALKARVDIVEIVGRHVALKRRGRAEWWGCCPFHKDRTPSFKVDSERQSFRCWGCDARGDTIKFLARIEGVGTGAAIRQLCEIAGNPGQVRAVPRPAKTPAADANEPDPEAERNRERAQEIWRQTDCITDGLPFRYLTERRGLFHWDCDRVRLHPECPWQGGKAGCIVVPVTCHRTGYVVNVWCILPVLEGKVQRLALGPMKASAARLFPADGHQIVIAEGVEDALAAHESIGVPAWAALSAGNMAALILPSRLTEVLILADADSYGQEGAYKLAARLQKEGRTAVVQKPIAAKDANDVLRTRRAG